MTTHRSSPRLRRSPRRPAAGGGGDEGGPWPRNPSTPLPSSRRSRRIALRNVDNGVDDASPAVRRRQVRASRHSGIAAPSSPGVAARTAPSSSPPRSVALALNAIAKGNGVPERSAAPDLEVGSAAAGEGVGGSPRDVIFGGGTTEEAEEAEKENAEPRENPRGAVEDFCSPSILGHFRDDDECMMRTGRIRAATDAEAMPVRLLYGRNDNDYDEEERGTEGPDDDVSDDCTCCSGVTVVTDAAPPLPSPTASLEEKNRIYWEWCYGSSVPSAAGGGIRAVWSSASRAPPAKSCVSMKLRAAMIPSLVCGLNLHLASPSLEGEQNKYHKFSTPTGSVVHTPKVARARIVPSARIERPCAGTASRVVRFGSHAAVEFRVERPAVEMTRLPPAAVEELFPVDEEDAREPSRELT